MVADGRQLAVTGTVSGAGSLTLDGGLANLWSLDGTNVSFGGASAALRIQGLSGTSDVSGMQVGDIFDLAGQQGVALTGDTVTTKSGMSFLSPAPAGDTYRLIHSQDGTAVVLTPVSGHGMSEMGTADTGLSFATLDDLPNVPADLLQHLGISLSMSSLSFTAPNEMAGHAGVGDGLASAVFDLPTAGQHYVG
jgi:hypothetical protein